MQGGEKLGDWIVQDLASGAAGAESEARDETRPLWPSLRAAESSAN